MRNQLVLHYLFGVHVELLDQLDAVEHAIEASPLQVGQPFIHFPNLVSHFGDVREVLSVGELGVLLLLEQQLPDLSLADVFDVVFVGDR